MQHKASVIRFKTVIRDGSRGSSYYEVAHFPKAFVQSHTALLHTRILTGFGMKAMLENVPTFRLTEAVQGTPIHVVLLERSPRKRALAPEIRIELKATLATALDGWAQQTFQVPVHVEIVRFQDMRQLKQIEVTAKTAVLIGVHGMGLANRKLWVFCFIFLSSSLFCCRVFVNVLQLLFFLDRTVFTTRAKSAGRNFCSTMLRYRVWSGCRNV